MDIFDRLAVIASRSGLLNGIEICTAMRFYMAHIRISCQLLLLICHIDQYIESAAVGIALNDGSELRFIKRKQFIHGCAEVVEKTAMFITARARAGADSVRPN
jgi:hypothetical protein